ncbi:MAG: 4'-phosphopantetheinyl transferase superfamily protein [Chitinophagaceae bacterium]|jgi:phosphopantetheinyl transferase|nr:4'-phosphopantetheinyl transferase superfamily protein [Chitinophagaceae bacterium]MBP6045734.1 4'-phosphopantetheinyl transferase superfamily protein [Ferruginibacter sp.]MBK7346821.1 4'-phosphopantetheinyl transferase superfamily protein [Chitinophagaceae bacterium]MBK8773334.1 4'-phosphopantetheinyl transferase superfamily protein [Chitinophagaceae bacterium]MBK9958143.1 4'-phosphopantetheinyl transferase superfamily protein [Chitinophagaceae bacterium]
MPLVYQQNINDDTKLGLWRIEEPENFFLQFVPLQKKITHPHKRLQHLAGRFLLRKLFPHFPLKLIKIAETRKPFLPGEQYHFSISHCGDYAAVIVSSKYRVGVDVEWPQQKIDIVKHKFMGTKEFTVLKMMDERDELFKLTMAWSIKEAIFKWYGLGQLDFKKHMVIQQLYKEEELFTANCTLNRSMPMKLDVFAKNIEGNVLAWLVTEK